MMRRVLKISLEGFETKMGFVSNRNDDSASERLGTEAAGLNPGPLYSPGHTSHLYMEARFCWILMMGLHAFVIDVISTRAAEQRSSCRI
jgi:hypothetical protein